MAGQLAQQLAHQLFFLPGVLGQITHPGRVEPACGNARQQLFGQGGFLLGELHAVAGQAQPGPFGLQLIGGAELGHQGLPQCLVLAAGVGRAGPDHALQAGVVCAGFVRLLLVKLRQGLEQLGLQGLPVVRVQQQGVALGQGDALQALGHGRLVLACQSASNSFQVSASKFFQLLRLI